MQHAVLDLLRAALVPELGADVAAGTAGNVELVLVAVVALGALPHQLAVLLDDLDLAVVAAHLAVVALGVELGVHDVFVDELHHLDDGLEVILHVGHLDIADGAAGAELLEIAFKLELGEGVDLLGHMHVVGVGDIVLVGDAGDHAKTLLQAFGKLVGRGLQRRAVEAEVDVVLLFPARAGVVHVLHDLQRKGLGGRVGVAAAGHILAALIQAGVPQADGGVAAVQQLVDGLALFQAGQRAVLPQDGRGVAQRAFQAVVAAHQGLVAQLQALVKDLPELVKVAAAGQRHVHQVDGHDALVEAAVVFGLAVVVFGVGDVVPAVTAAVRRQEAAAAHAGVHVAVALGLAFGEFVLPHLLFADIVGHHALGRALGGQLGQVEVGRALADVVLLQHVDQLGEGRGDPDAGLVLDALVALAQHLLNDDGQVRLQALVVAGLAQVHEHRDERRLAVGGHQRDDLVLDGLHAALDLLAQAGLHDLGEFLLAGVDAQLFHLGLDVAADLLAADVHKGGQVGQADALPAVLVGRDLRDDLRGDVARGREGMRLLDQRARDDGAVLQHVVEVDKVAVVHVLGIVVGVMEVDDAFLVRFDDLRGQQHAHRQVFADLARHIVALDRVDGGVLVGVFLLDFLVVALDQRQDAVVGGVARALEALHIAVGDVFAGDLVGAGGHDGVLDQVLDLLDVHGMAAAQAVGLHLVRDLDDLVFRQALAFGHNVVGLGHSRNDLGDVEHGLAAVALDDLHGASPQLNRVSIRFTTKCIKSAIYFVPYTLDWRAYLFYRPRAQKSIEQTTTYCVYLFDFLKIYRFLRLNAQKNSDENPAAFLVILGGISQPDDAALKIRRLLPGRGLRRGRKAGILGVFLGDAQRPTTRYSVCRKEEFTRHELCNDQILRHRQRRGGAHQPVRIGLPAALPQLFQRCRVGFRLRRAVHQRGAQRHPEKPGAGLHQRPFAAGRRAV